jgi:hypothetical protein
MDEILITGNVVSLRSVSETKKVTTQEFYESLAITAGMVTPILPPQVIFYAARGHMNVFATHQPPQEKTICIWQGGQEQHFTIKLPHVYFFHKFHYSAFDDLLVFGAKEQAHSMTDMLYHLPLKNLYGDGRVCLGDDLKFNLEGRLQGKIIRVENYFWNSKFNSDLDSTYRSFCPQEWDGDPLTKWERLSREEGFDPCLVNWKKYKNWKEFTDILLERQA